MKKIEELAQQAGCEYWIGSALRDMTRCKPELEKFAELIVEECLKVVDPTYKSMTIEEEVGRYKAILEINKHFVLDEEHSVGSYEAVQKIARDTLSSTSHFQAWCAVLDAVNAVEPGLVRSDTSKSPVDIVCTWIRSQRKEVVHGTFRRVDR